MPRVTVYVPDDLKARMDEIGESANWSGLAQRAFREAALTHATRKDPTNMTNVIERLRASKERLEKTEKEQGRESGERWAREDAEYDELTRVARGFENMMSEHFPVTAADVQHWIDPDGEAEYMELWENVAGTEPGNEVSDAFAHGFADGARDVYVEIADKL